MIPVAAVAVGVLGVVGVVAVAHEDHSDHSDHSDYSDAAEKERRRERKRCKDLKLARDSMQETLDLVRATMMDAAGAQGGKVFKDWNLSEGRFVYRDISRELDALDYEARSRVGRALECAFGDEERARQREMDEINELLRKIAQARLTEKQ